MHKLLWISTSLAAAALTAGTVYFNNSASVAGEDISKQRVAAAKASAGKASPAADPSRPVVIEFFTSQGCSSCPPSDRLAARMAAEPGVLVIQRPVTYWDRLGWRDTLGKSANTDLQRAYARRTLDGRNGVYTPQAVINGRAGLVGSREADLRQIVAKARSPKAPQVKIMRQANGSHEVMIAGATAKRARVQLVGLDRSETVRIGRGENGGRTLKYTNIFKGADTLGTLMGGEASFIIDAADTQIVGANAYAVIVREGSTGPILAGRLLPTS